MKTMLMLVIGVSLSAIARGQDVVTDTTPPQPPPLVYPAPDPRCEIALAPAGTSNFVRIAVGPTLSKPIVRELVVRVDRNGLGTVTGGAIEMKGQLTPAQLNTMWQAINNQWTLPESATGKTVSDLYLQATNTGTGRVTINLK